ncbi:hypothetical protein JXC34_00560, partial [Candidatus Woesearchaeota archaeon]|nr:hypothetical protein [Candidatus Woesearchaeota archaeon]
VLLLIVLILVIPVAFSRSGSMKLLAVSNEDTDNPKGSIANINLEVQEGSGRVFMDSFPLSKVDTQISTRFAKEVACNFLEADCSKYDFFYTIRAQSNIVGGPSASAAISVLTISVLEDLPVDETTAITGTINTGGIIGPVGGILPKIKAAADAGITKVLIPKFSDINSSNLTDYREVYDVEIIEVSQLRDAVREITGKEYGDYGELNISDSYLETMRSISEGLCLRAAGMADELYPEEDTNNTATTLLKRGTASLESGQYYSAASYCFGSALNLRHDMLSKDNLDKKMIGQMIDETRERVDEFKEHIEKNPLDTMTDLEAYMVVTDRLLESGKHLDDARLALSENTTNNSIYYLSYAIERLNSAYSWSDFFGKPGRKFDINKKVLDESCLKKISEVEERIQYIELYLPSGTDEVKEAVVESYHDYYADRPELCLYKSSIAKAKIDLILNNMAIDYDEIDDVIEDRADIVRSIIAKQNKRDIFPVLGYSYFEYANSLKENDKYSALLYLEYALELGNLDIYFQRREINLPRLETDYLLLFFAGFFSGACFVLIVGKLILMRKRKKKAGR